MNSKTNLLCYLIFLCASLTGAENFKVPSSAYSTDEFEEAKVEAQKRGVTISYVFAGSNSTCPLHNNATENALSKLNKGGVVVFVNAEDKSFYDIIPIPIITALHSKKAGNFIPKVVSSDSEVTKILGIMPYQEMKKNKSWDKAYRKSLEHGDDLQDRDKNGQAVMKWYLKDKPGRHYEGSFVSLKEGILRLNLISGKMSNFDINHFTQPSIDYAKAQNIFAAESIPVNEHEMETWTSSDGRTLEGIFVNLVGDELTLETSSGQKVSFLLSRLSVGSQDRARTIASQK